MAVALVQSTVTINTGTVALAGVAAGNTLICFITSYQHPNPTITDNLSSVWTHETSEQWSTFGNARIIHLENTVASSYTVTCSVSTDTSLVLSEWSGVATASALDVASGTGTTGTGTAAAAQATGTMSAAGNLMVAVVGHLGTNPTITPDAGWATIQEAEDGNTYMPISAIWKASAATTTETPSWTLGSSQNWGATRLVLKASGGGGAAAPIGKQTIRNTARPRAATR